MSNLQAAVGVAQFEKIDEHVRKKRLIGDLYQSKLKKVSSIKLPIPTTDYSKNIYWVFGIVIKDNHPSNAQTAMKELTKKGVGCRPFFWSLHEQPILRTLGYKTDESYPIAENLSRKGFYIPSGLALTEEQIDYVVDKVKEIFN